MDARELIDYLRQIAREQGEQALSPDEIDLMHHRISYSTYLNRCYAEAMTSKLLTRKPTIRKRVK